MMRSITSTGTVASSPSASRLAKRAKAAASAASSLKAKRYSDHPEYQKIAERYWYDGLRKAGLAEK
jgi:hypothetical protein